jgi:hypothetical protein
MPRARRVRYPAVSRDVIDPFDSRLRFNDAFVCEECSDPVEAQKLLDLYQCIIANIEWQMDERGGF